MKWSGGIVEWIEGDTAFISVVFSWKLPLAYQRAVWLGAQGYKVRAGGPAVTGRMKNYLGLVANTGGSVEALIHPANKKIYVLIGNEPFEACYRRIMQVIEWGCEPFVQPFIAPYSLSKNPSVRYDWTVKKLRALARWSNRWLWRSIPFADYGNFAR